MAKGFNSPRAPLRCSVCCCSDHVCSINTFSHMQDLPKFFFHSKQAQVSYVYRELILLPLIVGPRWEFLMDLLNLFVAWGLCFWFFPLCMHARSLNRFFENAKFSNFGVNTMDQNKLWESSWGGNISSGTYVRCTSRLDFQYLAPGLRCIFCIWFCSMPLPLDSGADSRAHNQ